MMIYHKILAIATTCLAACGIWGFSTTPQAMAFINVVDNVKVVDMKKCSKCGEVKPLNDFYKDDCQLSGFRPDCKHCLRMNSRSYTGRIKQIYNGQRSHRKAKGLCPPEYTYTEFENWVLSQRKYESLHREWVSSGYSKGLSPSIDRINNHEGYKIGNIQLLTWAENFKKSNMDIRRGDIVTPNLWHGGIKPIIGIDPITGKKVYFVSISDAKRLTGAQSGNICKVLKGKRPQTLGWTFKYNDNEV